MVSPDIQRNMYGVPRYPDIPHKNRQRQPAPGFNIVDEADKVLTSGRFKFG